MIQYCWNVSSMWVSENSLHNNFTAHVDNRLLFLSKDNSVHRFSSPLHKNGFHVIFINHHNNSQRFLLHVNDHKKAKRTL